jgi:hypothetical protein
MPPTDTSEKVLEGLIVAAMTVGAGGCHTPEAVEFGGADEGATEESGQSHNGLR